MFHRRGRDPTHTPQTAAAVAEQIAIQRRHRVQRRGGEEPSQTPPPSQIRTIQAAQAESPDEEVVDTPRPPRKRGRPPGQVNRATRSPGRPGPGRPSRGEEPLRNFDEEGPRFTGDDQECPLNPIDVAIKKEFDEALSQEEITFCPRCKERWFDVKLRSDGHCCIRCYEKDRKKKDDEPCFFSSANHLDFGSVPADLPRLEPLEEMFIARVHVSVNVFTVRILALLVNHVANSIPPGSRSSIQIPWARCSLFAERWAGL